MTGAQVARRVLDANGLNGPRQGETRGRCVRHYDPGAGRALCHRSLSGRVGPLTAVAAHGGALIRHAQVVRSSSSTAPCFTSSSRQHRFLFLLGGFFLRSPASSFAIALYAVAVLFRSSRCPSSSTHRAARSGSSTTSVSSRRTRARVSRRR
jgi:Zn-dependent membrane protease YugP